MIKLNGGHLYYSLGASAWYVHINCTFETIKLSESDYPSEAKAVAKAESLIASTIISSQYQPKESSK